MTIVDDFETLKMLPFKKKRGEISISKNISLPASSKGTFSKSRSLFELPYLPLDLSPTSKTTIKMRTSSISPQTQASMSPEFFLQHPATTFRSRENLGPPVGTFSSNESNSNLWPRSESESAITTTRHSAILRPRNGSHGSLFSLSGEDPTDYVPFPRARHFHNESLLSPGMATPPRLRGRRVTPWNGAKTPESSETALGLANGISRGGTTTTPAAGAGITGNTPQLNPSPSTFGMTTIFRTPVVLRTPFVFSPTRDAARCSLPRYLSLRPRVRSARNLGSVTRGVGRHHSETSVLFANQAHLSSATRNQPANESGRRSDDNNDRSNTSNDSGEEGEEKQDTPSKLPMIPSW